MDSISVLLPDFSCSTANQFLSLLTRGEARVSRVQLSPFEGLLRAVGIGEEVLRQFTSEARGRRTGNKEVEEVVKVEEEEEDDDDDDDDDIMVVSDSRDEKQQQQEQPQKQKQQQMQQLPWRQQQQQQQQQLSHKQQQQLQQQHSQQVPRKQQQWQQQQKEQQQLRRLQLQHHKQIKKLEQQHQFQQPEQQQLFPSPRSSPSPTGAASDHILSKMTRRDKLLKLKRICKRKAASGSEGGGAGQAGQRHHLVCPLCGEESENLGGILLHLTTGHFVREVQLRHKTELQGSAGEGGMTRYTCWKCRKDFPFSDVLLAHYGRAHSEVLDLTLSKVLKSADSPAPIMPGSVGGGKSASAIPTPKNIRFRGPRKKFRCPRCPLWADGASGVKQHLARVHFKEELLRDTGVMTSSPDFDPLTMTSPPSSGGRDCPSCGARMATLDTFLRHVGGAHGMVMRYLRPEER